MTAQPSLAAPPGAPQSSDHERYWSSVLADAPASGVPCDGASAGPGGLRQSSARFTLGPDASAQLRAASADQPFLVLAAAVAALQVCVSRYCHESDVTVYVPRHSRLPGPLDPDVALPIRCRLPRSARVKDVFDAARQALADTYRHQRFVVGALCELLAGRSRDNTRGLATVAIGLAGVNDPVAAMRMPSAIAIDCRWEHGRLSGVAWHSSWVAETSARRLVQQLEDVLTAMLVEPERSLGEIERRSLPQRLTAIRHFNRTSAAFPATSTIDALIVSEGRKHPGAAAVVGSETLTYGQLDESSATLAASLQDAFEIGRGSRVAVCLGHSDRLVVTLLAILRAGAAYVPIDPATPSSRVRAILEDSGARLLVTEARCVQAMEAPPQVKTFVVDVDCLPPPPRHMPIDANRSSDDLAYVIFTSGSSGRPKGTCIRHRSLVNYIWWARQVYCGREPDVFPLYSSLAFDLTVTSIFVPLVSGGSIRLFAADEDEHPVIRVFRDAACTVVKLTPSHLRLVVDRELRPPRLRALVVGGESFDTRLAARARAAFGAGVAIFNEYGPTEATVGCMIHRYSEADNAGLSVPIGIPAANSRIYVVDEELRPVAEGAIGELCIAGEGVAEGYLNASELTRTAFVDDPFVSGARLYRTGDLARWLPGEGLQYIGRRDAQVKFNGHRLELGELRHTLNTHPEIQDSVVRLLSADGPPVLVAYYESARAIDDDTLRAFLAKSIAIEVVPQLFERVDRLPLTVNGKVDVALLPDLPSMLARRQQAFIPPQTAAERLMAALWTDLLGVERIGLADRFFQLGGNSLLAMQLVGRIENIFGVSLPLASVFIAPTIEGVLGEIAERLGDRATVEAVATAALEVQQEMTAGVSA